MRSLRSHPLPISLSSAVPLAVVLLVESSCAEKTCESSLDDGLRTAAADSTSSTAPAEMAGPRRRRRVSEVLGATPAITSSSLLGGDADLEVERRRRMTQGPIRRNLPADCGALARRPVGIIRSG